MFSKLAIIPINSEFIYPGEDQRFSMLESKYKDNPGLNFGYTGFIITPDKKIFGLTGNSFNPDTVIVELY